MEGVDIVAMTKKQPDASKGMLMKVTFELPRSIFTPADITVQLDEKHFTGTPKVIAAELRDIRDDLS